MLVASNLPPSPVSITAISTFDFEKNSKAIATVISKKESLLFKKKLLCFSTKSVTNFLSTGKPLIFILSLKSIKCGDVYKPTFKPVSCRTEAIMCDDEPLPFVPAI